MAKGAAKFGSPNLFIPAHSALCRAADRLDEMLIAGAGLVALLITLFRLFVR